jgi:hypothetical protein
MSPLLASLGREGVNVAALARLQAHSGAKPGFVSEVITVLGQLDPEVAYRAVWLLRKAAAESRLDERDWARIAELVDASDHWIYRLTLCQLFAEAACLPALRAQVFPFLQRCFTDRRVIIRAWALSAMLRFRDDPVYRLAIQRTLRIAQRDPAKSMQARLRRLQAA